MKNRPFVVRLGFALAGIRACWRAERSFRTHGACTALALVALLFTRPSPIWWALFAFAIGLVLALELVNSALERLIDHLHPSMHPDIKQVKDMAAGGVLVASLAAFAIMAIFTTTLLR